MSHGGEDQDGSNRLDVDRRKLLLGGSTLLASGTAGCGFLNTSDATPTATPEGDTPSATPGADTPESEPTPTGTPEGDTPTGTGGASLGRYYTSLSAVLRRRHFVSPETFLYGNSASATLDAYEVSGDGVQSSRIDVESNAVSFDEAVRVEVPGGLENPWDATMRGVVENTAVEQGDVLLGVAYLRSPSAETDQPTVRYVAKDEDNTSTNMVRNANQPVLGPEWRRYFFRIKFDYSAEAGTWWTEFFMGFGGQTVDVGGLALIGFGDEVSLDSLPNWQQSYAYPGRGEDAQWRQEARSRVQDIRKADLEVNVVDPDGNAVEGATVEVAMQEHEFDFGTAIAVNQLPNGDPTYREKLLENFNKAVPENGLKVPAWEGRYGGSLGPESTRAAIDWLLEQGMPTRGHALVWEEYDWMGIDPDLSNEEINSKMQEKIRGRASEFEGDLVEWDMHNHPIWQSNIRDDIGREAALDWWGTAHDADSEAEMYINEMNIVDGGSYSPAYDRFISYLTDNDAGVDGIGFMGHFSIDALRPPEEILSTFDRFAEHGVPLLITEFDIELSNRNDPRQVAAQVDYLRDVLTAAFSHEAVEGVMSWGFWANEHWRPTAAYYNSDWSIRPHGEEFKRLVFEEWWTDASGETDPEGAFSVTGFKGEYEVTASDGELSGTATATLSDGGTSVEITIE